MEAAQLRFEHPNSGALRSVYMVPYDRDKFGALPVFEDGESPVKQSARGLEVSIWVEQGVLMATAGPSDAPTTP